MDNDSKDLAWDETEFLSVELHSEGEIEDLIAKGGFQQSVHITAWLLSRRKKAG